MFPCAPRRSTIAALCGLVTGLIGCELPDAAPSGQPSSGGTDEHAERPVPEARSLEPSTKTSAVAPASSLEPERRMAYRVLAAPESRAPAVADINARNSIPYPTVRIDELEPRPRAPLVRLKFAAPAVDPDCRGKTPREVITKLEETQGPVESAHYVFERGSEAGRIGERPRSVDGALSVIDCRWSDPDDPASTRSLWVGGMELEGAPEEFDNAIEHERNLTLFGSETITFAGRWTDARISDDTLHGMRRILDAGIEDEWSGGAQIWRREFRTHTDVSSHVAFVREDATCPDEMTLHLVLQDQLEVWELAEVDGDPRPKRVETLPPETIGTATLLARKVADEPEIIEAGQRCLPLRSAARLHPAFPLAAGRQISLPTQRIQPIQK